MFLLLGTVWLFEKSLLFLRNNTKCYLIQIMEYRYDNN